MVHGQNATGCDRSPVLVLPYPIELSANQSGTFDCSAKSSTRAQFVCKIREALAAGKMVLVQGCMNGNHIQFNEEEVRLWRGTLAQPIHWQGLNIKYIAVDMTTLFLYSQMLICEPMRHRKEDEIFTSRRH